MPNNQRPNPDALLAQMRQAEAATVRGKLRIYFGSSAGVGKTYAMLQAAHKLHTEGVDVLAGVVETHGRSETQGLFAGLPTLPAKALPYRGKELPEFDLDAALQRHPALVLVDELAHSNVPGSRHPKRWQDVEELLSSGINVYSTLNVQHLESLNDVVGGITGIRVQETLPDTFFDRADEVVMVDTPAEELLARLKAGKVYQGPQADRAASHFFRKGNLMALRELALRRTADRVEDDVQAWRSTQRIGQVWKTDGAILCAISDSPGAGSVVRSAALLAQQLSVPWHAVYVETMVLRRLPAAQRERTLGVVRLAADLGATTAVLTAQDVASALIAYAREHNLAKLVLGRETPAPWWLRLRGRWPLARVLADSADDLDLISVVAQKNRPNPPSRTTREQAQAQAQERRWIDNARHYGLATATCLGATALSWPLQWHFDTANIVMIYLLCVAVVALRLGRGAAVLASFLSVGLLDFFFVLPRMSFAVSDVQYLMTFGVMLAVGLIIGQLTAGLRYQAEVANERERRARRLFELTRELAGSLQMEQVLQLAEHSLGNEVQGVALVYFLDTQDQLQPSLRQAALPSAEQPDLGTARWALDQGEPAGMFTDTLPGSAWLYLPLKAPMRTRGVLALRPGSTRSVMLPELREQLETYARIIGQSLERVHYIDVAQAAVVGIESERLRNSLLSALSHDLRTPLAVVYGLADTLAALPNLPAPARDMTTALRQEAQRINAMVTNLLDMARLQSGTVHLRRQWLPVDEVVGSALQAMQGALSHHPVYTQVPAALPLVHIDAVLIERVLCNLLENAVKYTPPDSTITVAASVRGTDLLLCVSDNGPGLPPGSAELLFEKFTRGERESSIPGVGLGLAICRAIMAAHQGRIWAERAPQGGAAFYLSLPLGTPPSLPAPEDDAEIEDATARPAPVPASNP
ncbi:MAG: DUF4118 domain-containing protein [Burkholderiaceae bacterium]|jgi:two-component system sensor histidine kinase KdpD|nr:DUF4118 domain-containing protein [Burkholderiaceae bacterium]